MCWLTGCLYLVCRLAARQASSSRRRRRRSAHGRARPIRHPTSRLAALEQSAARPPAPHPTAGLARPRPPRSRRGARRRPAAASARRPARASSSSSSPPRSRMAGWVDMAVPLLGPLALAAAALRALPAPHQVNIFCTPQCVVELTVPAAAVPGCAAGSTVHFGRRCDHMSGGPHLPQQRLP